MHHALLIDDESSARADLRTKLAAHSNVTIIAEAATIRSARTLLARRDYNLVFMDIQLIGGNAFNLVGDVREGARIVFVTAYDSYAMRAFEINALDYLLKPVNVGRLAMALARLEEGAPMDLGGETAAIRKVALQLNDRIFLRSGLRAQFALLSEISLITARENYSEVRLAHGDKLFLRKSLKSWEDALPGDHFMRVHRTQIVNLGRVRGYQRDRDEHTCLEIEGVEETVSASRDRWGELQRRLIKLSSSI